MVWLDARARPQQRRFGETFGAARVHEISGKPLDVIPCLYRLIWLRENEPEVFAKTDVFAEVHGYLVFRLTGRWATSTASADPMGLLDMRRHEWSREILEAAGVPLETMPQLARPGASLGPLTPEAAAATGLPAGLPIFAGGGDGQCACTGVAGLEPGRAYVNLGTAAVAGFHSHSYAFHPAFRTETAIAEDGYIFETCVRSGTFLVDWLVGEVFGVEPGARRAALAALEREAVDSPIGAGGLTVAPYWQGSMTPHWDSAARGVIAGLTGSTRKADLFRAILEGVAIEIAESMDQAAAASGGEIDHYVAIGGGASSDLWAQIFADVAARPVRRSKATEASSLGAAMAAAAGVGWSPSIAEAARGMASETVRTFEPAPRRVETYRELRRLQGELWPLISGWNRRLADFADRNRASRGRG
jgi:xylulokinase